MNYQYLQELPLTVEEQQKLRSLAAPSALSLLEIIQAASDDFIKFFGKARSDILVQELRSRVDQRDLTSLTTVLPIQPASGVIISRAKPVLRKPRYSINRRNELYDELQLLRRKEDATPGEKDRMRHIEEQIISLQTE